MTHSPTVGLIKVWGKDPKIPVLNEEQPRFAEDKEIGRYEWEIQMESSNLPESEGAVVGSRTQGPR